MEFYFTKDKLQLKILTQIIKFAVINFRKYVQCISNYKTIKLNFIFQHWYEFTIAKLMFFELSFVFSD